MTSVMQQVRVRDRLAIGLEQHAGDVRPYRDVGPGRDVAETAVDLDDRLVERAAGERTLIEHAEVGGERRREQPAQLRDRIIAGDAAADRLADLAFVELAERGVRAVRPEPLGLDGLTRRRLGGCSAMVRCGETRGRFTTSSGVASWDVFGTWDADNGRHCARRKPTPHADYRGEADMVSASRVGVSCFASRGSPVRSRSAPLGKSTASMQLRAWPFALRMLVYRNCAVASRIRVPSGASRPPSAR